MAATRRLNQLTTGIDRRTRFPEGDMVVALSGGADSAALAALAAGRGSGVVRCLHVHHGLPASDALAGAAEAIARRLALEIEVAHVEVAAGPSPEARAREARYSAISDTTDAGASVLLGHTRDDQAETVLLNLIRGTGIRGLAGMPYFRPPNLYRPFLDVTRAETRELAALLGLPYRDDPSNEDEEIRRNRIRRSIIPILEELNPNLIETLARTAELVRADSDHLDALAASAWDPGRGRVSVGVIHALDPPLRGRVISSLISAVRGSEGATAAEVARVEEVAFGDARGAEIEGGLRVEVERGVLVITS